jgi:energy-coupling factor transporter ATP-binding protein EcfA2
MREQSRQTLDSLHIRIPALTEPIEKLSGGQRQAVAIARAVYWDARLMIMDEPTNNLGVPEQHKVLELIRMLKGRGVPVILITHVMPDALAVTDRIIVMHRGRKVAEKSLPAPTLRSWCSTSFGAGGCGGLSQRAAPRRSEQRHRGSLADRLGPGGRPLVQSCDAIVIGAQPPVWPRPVLLARGLSHDLEKVRRRRQRSGDGTTIASICTPIASLLRFAGSADTEGLRPLSFARSGRRISRGLRGKVRSETGLQRPCSRGAV